MSYTSEGCGSGLCPQRELHLLEGRCSRETCTHATGRAYNYQVIDIVDGRRTNNPPALQGSFQKACVTPEPVCNEGDEPSSSGRGMRYGSLAVPLPVNAIIRDSGAAGMDQIESLLPVARPWRAMQKDIYYNHPYVWESACAMKENTGVAKWTSDTSRVRLLIVVKSSYPFWRLLCMWRIFWNSSEAECWQCRHQ